MILIRVHKECKRFISKCLKHNINLIMIKSDKDDLIVKIHDNDLEEIVRLNYYSQIEIIKYYGIKGVLLNLRKYFFDYIMLLIFLIALYFISNIIIKIDINHENTALKERVNGLLIEKGIEVFTYRKDITDLNEISNAIVEENKDFLDWMSINRIGMKYVVSFEERIINDISEESGNCHIVAKKDGVITKIVADHGVTLVEKGDYVREGDIIISGEITLNEEVKDTTCASGEVLGETWYKVNITVPFAYQDKKYGDKSRYNFYLNGNYFYKKNYDHYDEEVIFKLDIFGNSFKIVKQKEYELSDLQYTKEEARKIALEESSKRLLEKIGQNSTVLEQKVLKETVNNSTIEMEIFIVVEENIGTTRMFEVGEEIDTE